MGPIPDTGSIVLPVEQTYTDGSVVSWSETEDDAELPAPVLYVNDAPAADHHAGGDDDAALEVTDSASTSSSDVLARVLGIGGLVLGVVALVIAITGRRKASV